MKKTLISPFFTLFSCIFLVLLLFYSKECITLASNGLLIWYRNMIPSLFPFMVLSGFIIRSGLSLKIGRYLQPFLGIFFHLPSQMLYVIFMGFLCGFPMGAKITADMLENRKITEKQGEYLLSFCNNIGPLYMLGYVIPLFEYQNTWKILGLMYLVPFGYGLFLRYFSIKYSSTLKQLKTCSYTSKNNCASPSYLICFQQSLSSSIEQLTILGGCMVFFNCLLIFPKILEMLLSKTTISSISPLVTAILSTFIEIGGGLQQFASVSALIESNSKIIVTNNHIIRLFLPLSLLTFGGASCITQTCFILKNTGLKIRTYIKHKLIQACIFIIFLFIF